MPTEQQAIEDEKSADREVREGRSRLCYVLRTNGFPAVAAVFASQGVEPEEEREYIGEPAVAPRSHSMAFSDPGLNLFRPPPMAAQPVTEAQVAEALAHTGTPVHPAGVTTASDAPPAASDGVVAALHVLRQRGIYNPTEGQVLEVLAAHPWLGSIPEAALPLVSIAPDAPPAEHR